MRKMIITFPLVLHRKMQIIKAHTGIGLAQQVIEAVTIYVDSKLNKK